MVGERIEVRRRSSRREEEEEEEEEQEERSTVEKHSTGRRVVGSCLPVLALVLKFHKDRH